MPIASTLNRFFPIDPPYTKKHGEVKMVSAFSNRRLCREMSPVGSVDAG